MCLILVAYKQHQSYPLILAANRDEFYDRPTRPADFWEDAPDILAGRDLKGLGTWMGVDRRGRLAAITNFRDPAGLKTDAPTRGRLVSNFLTGRRPAQAYLQAISETGARYNGFNLLVGDHSGLWHYSNRQGNIQALEPGIHGLSNHLLNTPWPKVRRGRRALARALAATPPSIEPRRLIDLLEDRYVAPDEQLPQTGVGLAKERMLAPMFIRSGNYGTRCTSVVLLDTDGIITFVEKNHPHPGSGLDAPDIREFQWAVEPNKRAN